VHSAKWKLLKDWSKMIGIAMGAASIGFIGQWARYKDTPLGHRFAL
jgi:hypothetical protein